MTLLLALVGCHADRVDRLEARTAELKAEVRKLTAEAEALKTALDAQPPPTRALRGDNDPPGFDAARPLPRGDARRPDVILLSIDTLRADHLGTYGYGRDTSPFLDRLGAEGTVFEQAWSPSPWTLPSHTTMLSGLLPRNHGAIDDHLRIPNDVPLIQETFRAAGYGTIGSVATMFVSSKYGFDRGFDRFQDFGIKDKHTNNLSTVDADQVFHHALHAAQEQPDGKPLFLFLHVYDVHYNYDPPAPWNEKFDRAPRWGDEVYKNYFAYLQRMVPAAQLEHQIAQYDEEIAFVDDSFRQLIETWRGAGREAIVVVTADHGEEFGERGSWGHGHTLWPEQLHVPLIVNGPGIASQRRTERVGTEDLASTVAELAGLRFQTKDGVGRAGSLKGSPDRDPSRVAAPFGDSSRFDTLVYRWHEPPWDLQLDLAAWSRALCNLEVDPTCRDNVYKQNRELGEAMFARMAGWLGEPWTANTAGTVRVEDGVLYQHGTRRNDALAVVPGDRFSVEPGDAKVSFEVGGKTVGPWRPLGGTIPGARCPVKFSGRWVVDAELPTMTDEEKLMLTQLGYLQEEGGGGAPSELPPSGPAPCP